MANKVFDGLNVSRYRIGPEEDQFATDESRKYITEVSEEAVKECQNKGGAETDEGRAAGLAVLTRETPQLEKFKKMMLTRQYLAMLAFYDPNNDEWARLGMGEPLDENTKLWSTDQLFGMGLRSRGAEEAEVIKRDLQDGAESAIICASGAGFNLGRGVGEFIQETGADPAGISISAVDASAGGLKHFKDRLRMVAGVDAQTFLRDLTHPKGIRTDHPSAALRRVKMAHEPPRMDFKKVPERADAASLIGFGMYIPSEDFELPLEIGGRPITHLKMLGLTSILASLWQDFKVQSLTFDVIHSPSDGPVGDAARLQHALTPVMMGRSLKQCSEEDVSMIVEKACPGATTLNVGSDSHDLFSIYTIKR